MRHVVFRVGNERFGLPLPAVREVATPASMSKVPRSPAAVRGIMNLRGKVVTVVHLGTLLGAAETLAGPAPENADQAGKVGLLDRGRRDLGLLVTEVEGIHGLEETSPGPGEALPSVRGVSQGPEGAVTILDADGLERQIASLFKPR